MTEDLDKTKIMRDQLSKLAVDSYKQGFADGRETIAQAFDKLSSDNSANEDASKLYEQIALIIRNLKIQI